MRRLFNFGAAGRVLPALAVLLIVGACGPARAADAPLRLLVLGDSLAAGFGLPPGEGLLARLRAALGPEVTVLDGTVSGDTTAGGLARLDWALGDRPTHALVELGGNDGLRGIDPAATEKNLDAIVVRLQAAGVKAMLAGMMAPPNLGREYVTAFDGIYRRVAARHGVPLYPFILAGVATDPALNQADGIHPNARGVEVVVQRLLPPLRAFLGLAGPAAAAQGQGGEGVRQ